MKITKWNYILTHETYRDDYWFLRDRIELVETLPNGDYINYPVVPHMKAKKYSKDEDVFDSTQWYDESDLTSILDDTLQELNK